jgi:hypothetical protein
MSNFTELFKGFNFDDAMAKRIKRKLGSKLTVEGLRQSVVGKTNTGATDFFKSVGMNPFDASALAGQLVPTGIFSIFFNHVCFNYFLYLSSHFSIALSALNHSITRVLLFVK